MARTRRQQQSQVPAGIKTITLTIETDEITLQRLANLLLFAPHTRPLFETEEPMPFDEPKNDEPPRPLEIDYEVVRRSIIKQLTAFSERKMVDRAKEIFAELGIESLSKAAEAELYGLWQALEEELKNEKGSAMK